MRNPYCAVSRSSCWSQMAYQPLSSTVPPVPVSFLARVRKVVLASDMTLLGDLPLEVDAFLNARDPFALPHWHWNAGTPRALWPVVARALLCLTNLANTPPGANSAVRRSRPAPDMARCTHPCAFGDALQRRRGHEWAGRRRNRRVRRVRDCCARPRDKRDRGLHVRNHRSLLQAGPSSADGAPACGATVRPRDLRWIAAACVGRCDPATLSSDNVDAWPMRGGAEQPALACAPDSLTLFGVPRALPVRAAPGWRPFGGGPVPEVQAVAPPLQLPLSLLKPS